MQQIHQLSEYESVELELSEMQLESLLAADVTQAVAVRALGGGNYRLTAGSMIGAVVTPSVSILIRPKIGLENVFLMLGVSVPAFAASSFGFDRSAGLLPAMAGDFAAVTDRATVRGVLRGYQPKEERLVSPRGRIDITEQMKHPATPIPMACRFDEHTADILLNRGLLSAITRLTRVPGLSPVLREQLLRLRQRFEEVSIVEVTPESLDNWVPGRLDGHYETAVRLASMILRHLSLQDQVGSQKAASFTIDMNDVFQAFVGDRLRQHLRGRLAISEEPPVPLAVDSTRTMRPDIVVERAGVAVYVGDSKYKLSRGQARINDYYQLLAYTTVMELPEGVLIYCQDTDEKPDHPLVVRNSGKKLVTYRLPMSGSCQEVENELEALARWIESQVSDALAEAV